MTTYKIVRGYLRDNETSKVVMRGLSLEEAQEHCRDPETSSRTCQGAAQKKHTAEHGEWFDGYEEE
jgi:hypothetical protein